ncbi:hypothetical protein [Bradyrhizobium sp. th.b2]|uniref:hypothetical protein n=1 Tax=Bradyrhizobium sp. th-b2 TaxID=172088 RepID=UPI00041E4351|nr:hypothetical protein [Bradyrhizobium sp. th.b2]
MNQPERAKYVKGARRLRASMRLNLQDAEFASEGGQIVYFADANVVAMFTDPASHRELLGPFNDWLQDDQAFATLTMTAEFLFSGNLPGQRGLPMLISIDHYEELHSMAAAIKRNGERWAATAGADLSSAGTYRNQLDDLVLNYRHGDLNTHEFMMKCSELLPRSMVDLLQGPVSEAVQFRRLLGGDMLQRADTMTWFDRSLLHPNPQHVADWTVAIRTAAPKRTAVKTVRDARSIVQVMELSKREDYRGPEKRYVLITSDSAIHVAYLQYRQKEIRAGRRPIELHLRQPTEFVPLLNLGSMGGNEVGRLELFPEIEKALERLLRGDRLGAGPADPSPQDLNSSVAVAGMAGDPSSDTTQIESLRKLWSRAAAQALALNASYIARRDTEHFVQIVNVLSNGNVVDAALQEIRSVVHDLNVAHARYSVAGILQKFVDDGRARARNVPAFGARRAPLVIRPQIFRSLVGNLSINDYLEALISDTSEFRVDGFDPGDKDVALLFAACVALTAEDWISARAYAERAMDEALNVGNEAMLNEARYCCAVALRFTMKSPVELARARSLLDATDAYCKSIKDELGRLRAAAESAALFCVAAYKMKLVSGTEFARTQSSEIAKTWKTSRLLAEQADELYRFVDSRSAVRGGLHKRIGLQIASINAALALFSIWIDSSLRGDAGEESFAGDLEELENRSREWSERSRLPYTANVFIKVLRFVLEKDERARVKAGLEAEELLRNLLIYEEVMTDFDSAEYKFFLDRILAASQQE